MYSIPSPNIFNQMSIIYSLSGPCLLSAFPLRQAHMLEEAGYIIKIPLSQTMDLTPPRKRRRGEVKLTEGNLIDKLGAAICSLGSSELAILQLLNHYDIDLDDLRRVLLGLYSSTKHIFRMRYKISMTLADKGLDVSFSRVKYFDIAPRVGLKFELAGNDMPTFDIHRARIPTPLFGDIINDLEVVMKQYGLPIRHKNVEARSRLLAPVSA